jgi:ribosomal protein L30/L7E
MHCEGDQLVYQPRAMLGDAIARRRSVLTSKPDVFVLFSLTLNEEAGSKAEVPGNSSITGLIAIVRYHVAD